MVKCESSRDNDTVSKTHWKEETFSFFRMEINQELFGFLHPHCPLLSADTLSTQSPLSFQGHFKMAKCIFNKYADL